MLFIKVITNYTQNTPMTMSEVLDIFFTPSLTSSFLQFQDELYYVFEDFGAADLKGVLGKRAGIKRMNIKKTTKTLRMQMRLGLT